MLSPFEWWCRNFILPEICKPCLFLLPFQFAKLKLSEKDFSEPAIPGNRPYKKAGGAGMVPKPTKECTNCGICAAECPVLAIDQENSKKVDEKACISCMRCISVCPQDARKVNPVMLSAASLMLKKVCSERRECELFL